MGVGWGVEQEHQGEASTSDPGVEWVCRWGLPEARTAKGTPREAPAQMKPQRLRQHGSSESLRWHDGAESGDG